MAAPLFSIILLFSCVFLAQAQTGASLTSIPICGAICLVEFQNVSSCAQFNYNQTCLCGDQTYKTAVESCVLSSCTVKESLVTKNATQATCGVAPRDRSYELYVVVVALGVLTSLVVVARVAFRLLVNKRGLFPDDWAILATLLVGMSGTIFIAVGAVPNGVGKDLWTLTSNQITNFGLWFFLTEVQYFIDLTLMKLSLLLFYLRIFPSTTVRRLLWATVVFDVLFGLAFVMAALLQCRPISYFWTNWDGEHQGLCMNVNAVGWANAAVSIFLDFWMLALPLSQLTVLRLHWKKKVGVVLMFVVGTFVTVVSIIRLQSLVTFANSGNLTYDNWDVNFWSAIEVNIGIMCACMPTMRQILAWYFPKAFGSGSRPGKYYPGSRYQPGSHGRGFKGRNLVLKRTESGTTLNRSDVDPPPSLKGPPSLYPLSPATIVLTPSPRTGDFRGNGEQRPFPNDETALEENEYSVQLADLKKSHIDT